MSRVFSPPATPELIDLHIKMADEMAEKMARALKSRGSKLSAVQLMAIARTMVNSMNTGLDVSMRLTGTEQRHFVSEVLASQEAYLDLYLGNWGALASASAVPRGPFPGNRVE